MTSHRALYGMLVLAVCIPAGMWAYRTSMHEDVSVVIAQQRDVEERVVITGKARAAEEVDLGFSISGRIRAVFVEDGEQVTEGQTLLALDEDELRGSLAQAYATKRTEEAEYASLEAGPRGEDIEVAYAQREAAKTALVEAERLLLVSALDAYSKADDTIYRAVDQLFSNPATNPTFNYPVNESLLKTRLEAGRGSMSSTLQEWAAVLNSEATLDAKLRVSLDGLASVRDYLALVTRAVGALPPSTAHDALKTAVATARSVIDASLSSLETAQKNVSIARSDVALADTQAVRAEAGTTAERLAVQRARIAQADAQIRTIEARLKDVTLTAPIAGVVTRQDGKRGQVTNASETLVSIKSMSRLEVEAFVPEISIGKVAVGNPAALTFDAFPAETFDGSITHIDESETVRDGVTNYKVIVSMKQDNPRLRSGMSADIAIVTAQAPRAVAIPQYVISVIDGTQTVEKIVAGRPMRTRVKTGVVGADGYVEIVAGVVPGDSIVVPFGAAD